MKLSLKQRTVTVFIIPLDTDQFPRVPPIQFFPKNCPSISVSISIAFRFRSLSGLRVRRFERSIVTEQSTERNDRIEVGTMNVSTASTERPETAISQIVAGSRFFKTTETGDLRSGIEPRLHVDLLYSRLDIYDPLFTHRALRGEWKN